MIVVNKWDYKGKGNIKSISLIIQVVKMIAEIIYQCRNQTDQLLKIRVYNKIHWKILFQRSQTSIHKVTQAILKISLIMI